MTFLTFLHPTFRETQDLISLATIIYFEKVKKKRLTAFPLLPDGSLNMWAFILWSWLMVAEFFRKNFSQEITFSTSAATQEN